MAASIFSHMRAARRTIRKIWLKELLYFRSNHPFYMLTFITIFLTFYAVWWMQVPNTDLDTGQSSSQLKIFDNFRFASHKFVRVLICIPEHVVDYRFSTVTDAIHLTHLDYPDLKFTKSLDEARTVLESGNVDILIHFTTLIETGKQIDYNIISPKGDLNKHYCIHCDNHRKQSWGSAIEAQVVVNRFLYWLIKSRGFIGRKPDYLISNVYIEGNDADPMFSKRQTDLFIAWLLLVPICARLVDSWNSDRKSGIYKVLLSLKMRRFEYFVAKFQFWYAISLLISVIAFVVNVSTVPQVYTATYLPFIVIYVASIIMFWIFLATLFPGSPFFAKFVGLLLMAAGEFGFGEVYQGIWFFQLSVRFFGKSTPEGHLHDFVALVCMTANLILMFWVSLYLDTYFYHFSPELLPFYFPLERSYWWPTNRTPEVDKYHAQQILAAQKADGNDKNDKNEVPQHSDASMKKDKDQKPHEPKELKSVPFIVLYGVCKRVNTHWRVNQLSLTIRYGEILTLYGHQGCGSEEILAIINGEMHAEFGEVMTEKSQRALVIARASEEVPEVNYWTVTQYLEAVSSFRGITLQDTVLTEVLDELDLLKCQDRPLDLLTTTQKERVRIGAAFVGQPDVVLIDWPTRESLPEWKYMILRFIEKRKEKKAIVIASYEPEETEAISDRVVLLSEGYVVLNGACETYRQSMSSVFEIRLWPMTGFTDADIQGVLTAVTLGDERMKADAKYFETPNGKLRITLPVIYRRSIPLILKELETVAFEYQIAFYELGKPNIHDVYTNACYEPRQYAPLANYHHLKDYYAQQKPISRTAHFFRNLVRILRDRQFLFQITAVVVLFVIVALLTLVSYQEQHQHFTHEVSLEAHDYPITIICADCVLETANGVTYLKKLGDDEFGENRAYLFWKNDSKKADTELVAISRGDDTFTMVVQNFAVSQLIARMTGRYPKITPTLESRQFRASSTTEGFSWVFNDVNKNQAAMILSESYSLMYLLGVFQTFVYTISVILPLRLVAVNMRPDSMLFPWPRYLYFGLIFAANTVIFLVIAVVLATILVSAGFFAIDTAGCVARFLGCWLLVYISTLPLIYVLVFNVNNAMAVIPTVMTVSTLFVNLPNMVSSFSAENAISLQTLLKFVSWTCMFSPPTALQVLVAFLNAGEFHEENRGTITVLTVLCCAHVWILGIFALMVFRPGFASIRQYWFIVHTAVWSNFERGTTIKPGARMKNSVLFQPPSIYGPQPRTPAAGEDPTSKLSVDFVSGASNTNCANGGNGGNGGGEDLSHITNYEERLAGRLACQQRWNDLQEVGVDNAVTYLLGDDACLKSNLLRTITEVNRQETIAYVPFLECLPTIYTPLELLTNVAACHGYEVTNQHINYLLDAFGLLTNAAVPIRMLTDAERRILTLLSKLVIRPSIIILDQLDTFLPHPKMMTVWALCARLRTDGAAVLFTSRHNGSAEHTATSCAHMYKCQFVSTLPPSTIKSRMRCTVLEVAPKATIGADKLVRMLMLAMPEAGVLPATGNRVTLVMRKDDVDTIQMMLGVVRMINSNIHRYSLRSGNFDEYVASAFGK